MTGSDRAESSYSERLRGAGIAPVDRPRRGERARRMPRSSSRRRSPRRTRSWRSPASRGQRVLHRGDLLAEAASLKRCLAVSGTHGKTTTSGMAAHILVETGRDPAYLIGGELRSTGSNAAWGEGEWIVVEADESDRSFLKVAADVAVVTNIEVDHHSTYHGQHDVEEAFASWVGARRHDGRVGRRAAARRLRRRRLRDRRGRPARRGRVPGRGRRAVHGRRRPGVAAAPGRAQRAERAGRAGRGARRGRAAGRGGARAGHLRRAPGGGSSCAARPRAGAVGLRRLRPPPDRGGRDAGGRAHAGRRAGSWPASSRTCTRVRSSSSASSGARWPWPTSSWSSTSTPRARTPRTTRASTGFLVARAAADAARGRPVYWLPAMDDAAARLAGMLGDGDLLVTLGAGNVDQVGRRAASPARRPPDRLLAHAAPNRLRPRSRRKEPARRPRTRTPDAYRRPDPARRPAPGPAPAAPLPPFRGAGAGRGDRRHRRLLRLVPRLVARPGPRGHGHRAHRPRRGPRPRDAEERRPRHDHASRRARRTCGERSRPSPRSSRSTATPDFPHGCGST